MANIIVMVGLPGSGKSTVAELYRLDYGYEVFSSDAIRAELFGNEEDQQNPALVFSVLYRRLIEAVKKNKNVVLDATNLTRKVRSNPFREIKDVRKQVSVIAHVVEPGLDVCLQRNAARYRQVPEDVIRKMVSYYEAPSLDEGFDRIL